MAVENAEAPGRQHEQAGARKQDADDGDRQLALFAREARRDERDEQRRGEDAEQHEHCRDERQQRRDRARDARGLSPFLARDERGVHRNERRRQRAFAEQVLKEIGNAERGHERVGRIGLKAEVLGEEPLADEAGEPAAERCRTRRARKSGPLEADTGI